MGPVQIEEQRHAATSANDRDSASDGNSSIADAPRCKYPSKYCGRARAEKSNGSYHRFCQYHRLKANSNQKRWTSVRRKQAAMEGQQQQKQQQEQQHDANGDCDMRAVSVPHNSMYRYRDGMHIPHWMPALLPDPVSLNRSPEPIGLAVEDIEILHALFVNDVSTHDQWNAPAHQWNWVAEPHPRAFV